MDRKDILYPTLKKRLENDKKRLRKSGVPGANKEYLLDFLVKA
jgi:hypothetical protein